MSCEERRVFEEYVNLVEKCMNFDVNPENDFIEYACGRYREEDFDGTIGEYPPSYKGLGYIYQTIRDNERISSSTIQKARDFRRSHSACLQGGLKEYLRSDQFNEYCGGLPAFNDNWNADLFNWVRALGIFSALQFNVILSLTIEYLDDIKVIFITAREFPDYSLSQIESILTGLDLYDQKLAEVVNDLNLFIESYPRDLGDEHFRRLGHDLQDYVETFDFKEFIEIGLCITINDHDIIHFKEGVMTFVLFLSRLDRRVLGNYLTVMATYECANWTLESMFDVKLTSIFNPAIISVGFETYYNKIEDRKYRYLTKQFNHSFDVIKATFPENLRETEKEAFRENIDEIIEFIAEHYNPVKIEKEYANLQISPNDFHQNLINIKNHGIPESVKILNSLRGTDQSKNQSVINLIDYFAAHWQKPIVFHFSGQQTVFWWNLTTKRYDNNLLKNNRDIDRMIEILESQVASNPELANNFWPESIICTTEALTYAYSDYRRWMRENEDTVRWQNEILSRIKLDCYTLFFVAFAQHSVLCNPPEKCTTTMSLMNNYDFWMAFRFSRNCRMNPKGFV